MAIDTGGPVLCVAPLVPGAGVDTLLTAFGLLCADRPALRLEVIGSGPQEALRGHVRALGLEERVRFRGRLRAAPLRTVLSQCSMLVLPRREDDTGPDGGLPSVLLQAMASGVPVVSTDLVGSPDRLRQDATGLHVPPDVPTGLAAAMATLLDDPARAAEVGATGRRLVASFRDREGPAGWDGRRHQVG